MFYTTKQRSEAGDFKKKQPQTPAYYSAGSKSDNSSYLQGKLTKSGPDGLCR